MNNHLYLSDYQLDLISNALSIMLKVKAKDSIGEVEGGKNQKHENLSLELFELYLKFKSLNTNHIDLSPSELKLIDSGITLLAILTYKESLKEKDKTQYYENCNLQFVEIRKKFNNIKSYRIS